MDTRVVQERKKRRKKGKGRKEKKTERKKGKKGRKEEQMEERKKRNKRANSIPKLAGQKDYSVRVCLADNDNYQFDENKEMVTSSNTSAHVRQATSELFSGLTRERGKKDVRARLGVAGEKRAGKDNFADRPPSGA